MIIINKEETLEGLHYRALDSLKALHLFIVEEAKNKKNYPMINKLAFTLAGGQGVLSNLHGMGINLIGKEYDLQE